MKVQTLTEEMVEAGKVCDHCKGRSLERCPSHSIKTADKWCVWCDTPEVKPPLTSCRCQER